MKNRVFLAAALGGLLMSTAATFAQQTTQPAAPAAQTLPQQETEDPNEVICKAGEPIVGSRFPGPRTCHTRREWHQIQQDSQNALFQQQMERSAPGGK